MHMNRTLPSPIERFPLCSLVFTFQLLHDNIPAPPLPKELSIIEKDAAILEAWNKWSKDKARFLQHPSVEKPSYQVSTEDFEVINLFCVFLVYSLKVISVVDGFSYM